jgi:hypothetical protein
MPAYSAQRLDWGPVTQAELDAIERTLPFEKSAFQRGLREREAKRRRFSLGRYGRKRK